MATRAMATGAVRRATPAVGVAATAAPAWVPLVVIVTGAWSILLLGDATGIAPLLHHHALISPGGPPLPLATVLFLGGWLVMIAGMMLPASSPAILVAGSGRLGGFLLAYVAIWLAFGLAAFVGDIGVHALVHATPWLLEHPWLIGAVTLITAGLYQLTRAKHRALDACRHPLGAAHANDGVVAGRLHAVDCLRSSWALMLVMFGVGFAGLGWMLLLTGVMTYEAVGRHGHRLASAFGIALLLLAGVSAWIGLTSFGAPNGLF